MPWDRLLEELESLCDQLRRIEMETCGTRAGHLRSPHGGRHGAWSDLTRAPVSYAALREGRQRRSVWPVRETSPAEPPRPRLLDRVREALRARHMSRRTAPYLADTRRYLLRRFPFFVVFREVADRVQIVAVAHARRRPGYWLGR